jgi:hypothetical protein
MISEMAEILGIAPNTLYDTSALDAIRSVPGKERPPKSQPEATPKKPAKK